MKYREQVEIDWYSEPSIFSEQCNRMLEQLMYNIWYERNLFTWKDLHQYLENEKGIDNEKSNCTLG